MSPTAAAVFRCNFSHPSVASSSSTASDPEVPPITHHHHHHHHLQPNTWHSATLSKPPPAPSSHPPPPASTTRHPHGWYHAPLNKLAPSLSRPSTDNCDVRWRVVQPYEHVMLDDSYNADNGNGDPADLLRTHDLCRTSSHQQPQSQQQHQQQHQHHITQINTPSPSPSPCPVTSRPEILTLCITLTRNVTLTWVYQNIIPRLLTHPRFRSTVVRSKRAAYVFEPVMDFSANHPDIVNHVKLEPALRHEFDHLQRTNSSTTSSDRNAFVTRLNHIISTSLPWDRPLWCLHLFRGWSHNVDKRSQSATLVLRAHHALTDTFGLVKLFLSRVADSHKGVMPAHLVVQQSSTDRSRAPVSTKSRFNPLSHVGIARRTRKATNCDNYQSPPTNADLTSASAGSGTSSTPTRRKQRRPRGRNNVSTLPNGTSNNEAGRTDAVGTTGATVTTGGGGAIGESEGMPGVTSGFNTSGDGEFSYTNTNTNTNTNNKSDKSHHHHHHHNYNHNNGGARNHNFPQLHHAFRRRPIDFALNLRPSTWNLHLRQPSSAFTRPALKGRTQCGLAMPLTVHEMSIRRAARRLHVTFNDFLLGAVSGGCRMYLCTHGDDVFALRGLRVALPLPLHSVSEMVNSQNGGDTAGECFSDGFYDPHDNEPRTAATNIPLCVEVADRMTRLKRCAYVRKAARSKRYGHGKKVFMTAKKKIEKGYHHATRNRTKHSTQTQSTDGQQSTRRSQDDGHNQNRGRKSTNNGRGSSGASILFSNVAGPLEEICIGYVDVSEIFLLPPAGTQVPVNVGIVTYNGVIFLSVSGDSARLSDPQELIDAIVNEIHALTALSYSSKVSRKA